MNQGMDWRAEGLKRATLRPAEAAGAHYLSPGQDCSALRRLRRVWNILVHLLKSITSKLIIREEK